MVTVVPGAEPVITDETGKRVSDLDAVALGVDGGVEKRGEIGLGERKGGHVGAQRDGLRDTGLSGTDRVFVGDLHDLVTPGSRERFFQQARGAVERDERADLLVAKAVGGVDDQLLGELDDRPVGSSEHGRAAGLERVARTPRQ